MRKFVNGCSKLSTMEFPKLESVGYQAFAENFENCPKLHDIYFPSLISVNSEAFYATGTGTKFHFKKSLEGNSQFTAGYLGLSNANQIVFDI